MKKEERILNALGEVDDSFISEAAPKNKVHKKSKAVKWSALAACLAATIVLAVGIFSINSGFKKSETARLENGETVVFAKGGSVVSNDMSFIYSRTAKSLTAEQVQSLFGKLPIKADGLYSDEDGRLVCIEGNVGDIKVEIGLDGNYFRDTIIESDTESVSQVNGVRVKGGLFLTDRNSKGERYAIYYASFKLGDDNVYVEGAGKAKDGEKIRNDVADVIYKLINNGEINADKINMYDKNDR